MLCGLSHFYSQSVIWPLIPWFSRYAFLDILCISLKPNVCGFRRKPFAQIFAESSSLPAPELWWSCQPVPRFSPLYFSFLPVKRRDFPGNVRSGGCDSLPLVGRFLPVNSVTHRSAMLSISFGRISHQMCCARGKRLGKNLLSDFPEKNARKALGECGGCKKAFRL